MSTIKIIHNPRCSKSRQTLALLEQKEVSAEIIEYLKTPLSKDELKKLYTQLNIEEVVHMMRPKEAEFKEAGLDKTTSTDEELFDAMVAHPKLLERPIVINGDQARIGRPPESVLEIL
ncbi:arsenate reductase (glutaredoxin) [Alteromonas sp. ASW11-130]|uniref:arsenate reductase (glutaredoxin) n=1 Tax=Alteromonas sp. ASW11-130 TaxID=3015775 RepID=UPI0022424F1B|nr:arsenate reductase (glutaredoxin) [Alteromonas sp. ASW11-130]MCW8092422.1 arsenate reductase (glutaredoxin) [Alteromonas sp. ASW11-130]